MNRIALLGGLLLSLVSCGQEEEPAPPEPPPAPPAVEIRIDERRTALDALEKHLAEFRTRLEKGQEAAGRRSLEIQAAWSVSLRELRLRLDEIDVRLRKLRKRKNLPWKMERDRIQKAVDDLKRQFEAELLALRSIR